VLGLASTLAESFEIRIGCFDVRRISDELR